MRAARAMLKKASLIFFDQSLIPDIFLQRRNYYVIYVPSSLGQTPISVRGVFVVVVAKYK